MSMRHTLQIGALFTLLLGPSASAQTYVGTLLGSNEAPPNASPGSGSVVLVLDGTTLLIDVSFAGLSGSSTAAHIHCCSAPGTNVGVATQLPSFSAFPLNVSQGQHVQALDLTMASSFNPSFITNNGGTLDMARAALLNGLEAGNAYYNLHSSTFPGGEIRANLLRLDLFSDGFEQAPVALLASH